MGFKRRCPCSKLSNAIWIACGIVLLVNLLAFNFTLYYAYTKAHTSISHVTDRFMPGKPFLDVLNDFPWYHYIIKMVKEGGLLSLQQETIERLFLVSQAIPNDMDPLNTTKARIAYLGVDVSRSGEATFIYRRILSRRKFPFAHLVVDIGANDGLMSSNSFNFIQWGWDAILVEPLKSQLDLAEYNTRPYIDPYGLGRQQVQFVNVLMSDTDGVKDFVQTKDAVAMENYEWRPHEGKDISNMPRAMAIHQVESMTVRTFVKKYSVPERFAILSIDAEGNGAKILHQWLDGGHTPAYIIYESLHNHEFLLDTIAYVERAGYKYLKQKGWNLIFEYRPSPLL